MHDCSGPFPRMHSLLRAAIFFTVLATSSVLAVDKPTISDLVLTSQANGAATVAVKVTANGEVATLVVRYGRTTAYGDERQSSVSDTAVGKTVTTNLSGLIGGQTYYVKVDMTLPEKQQRWGRKTEFGNGEE